MTTRIWREAPRRAPAPKEKKSAHFTLRQGDATLRIRPLTSRIGEVTGSGDWVECPRGMTWWEAAGKTASGNTRVAPSQVRPVFDKSRGAFHLPGRRGDPAEVDRSDELARQIHNLLNP